MGAYKHDFNLIEYSLQFFRCELPNRANSLPEKWKTNKQTNKRQIQKQKQKQKQKQNKTNKKQSKTKTKNNNNNNNKP